LASVLGILQIQLDTCERTREGKAENAKV